MEEQLDNLRRLVDRLRASAEQAAIAQGDNAFNVFVDYANHALSEIEVARDIYKREKK